MTIVEENARKVKFLGIREAGMFEMNGRYYIKLDRVHTMQNGAEINAVGLEEGILCAVDVYTEVRDLSGYILNAEGR